MSESKMPSCEICGKVFQNHYNLTVHKRIHMGERPYKCSYCERAFSHPSSYSQHLVSAHGGEKGLKLSPKKCNPNFRIPALRFASHLASLGKHEPKITSNTSVFLPTEFTCTICNLKYTSIPALKCHMRLHRLTDSSAGNKNKPSSKSANKASDVCTQDKCSKIPSASIRTQGTKVSDQYKIPKLLTNESTPSNETPSVGDNISRKTKEYIGMICKPHLYLANVYSKHSKSSTAGQKGKGQKVQTESEPPEVVDDRIVAEKSQTEGNLDDRNIQSQTYFRTPHVLTCAECDETFLKAKDLSKHMMHHPNYDEKNSGYRCPECRKMFEFLINLRRHIVLAHTNFDKLNVSNKLSKWTHTYECSICKQGFHTRYSFTRHKRLHKGFDTKSEQVLHSKTRYDQGPLYKCQHCPSSFTLKVNRRRHVLHMHRHSIKSGVEKPCGITKGSSTYDTRSLSNECTQCGFSFSQKHLLQKHVMKVHWTDDDRVNQKKQRNDLGSNNSRRKSTMNRSTDNAIKFSCDTCGASYSTQHDLKRHITIKHYKDVQSIVPLNKRLVSEVSGLNEADLRECVVVCDSASRYYCEKCNANYSKRSDLRKHIIAKHYDIVQNVVPVNYTMESERRKAILREYVVATDKLSSVQTDPVTGKNFYICEICSTTYTTKESLGRHVKHRANDHGMYLRKRSEQDAEKMRVNKQSTKCDICGNIFARRYGMLLHRQKHTDDQFSSAGVRRNLYRTADGTFVDIFGPMSRKPTAEDEVSSSTCKDTETNDAIETNTDYASVYVDRAEDEFVSMDTEPLFFARPYVTKEHTDDTNRPNTTGNIHITSSTPDCDETFHCEDNVITIEQRTLHLHDANKMQVTSIDHIGLKEQMNLDTSDITHTNTIDQANYIEQSYTVDQANYIEQSNTVDQPNNTEQSNTVDQPNNTEQSNTVDQPNDIEQLNTSEQSNTPEQTKPSEQRNSLKGINPDILPCTSSQGTDEFNTAGISPQPGLTVEDGNACSACSVRFQEGQNRLECKLCNKSFCQPCSGISTETYDIIFQKESRSMSGILWSCQTCRLLVPKFTLLLQQLGDFEHAINNRLFDLEKRVLKIAANGNDWNG